MAEIREVDAETMADIHSYATTGLTLLGLAENTAPKDIVAAITEYVRALKAEQRSLSKDDTLALGILLGWQYVHGLGWHWAEVVWDFDEDTATIGVLPTDNSLFINPMWWMNDTVNTDRATNFMLNYNMVVAHNVPPAAHDEALGFH